MKKSIKNTVTWFLVLLSVAPCWAISQEPNAGSAFQQEPNVGSVFKQEPNTSPVFKEEPNASPVFKQEELDQILAQVALYPDSLLSQVLMASTYPLEVVQAQRWVDQNKALDGNDLAAALDKQTWDPSVKSLVNFPQVLMMMSEKLDWTQKLGDAFLAQQKDVMDTIQKLRKKASEQGNLNTNEKQIVKYDEQQAIAIESADPNVIYVPTYDPTAVYGSWPYSDYPPYYYYPYDYYDHIHGSDIYYGPGFGLGAAWGWAWGQIDWSERGLRINPLTNRGNLWQNQNLGQGGMEKWQHNPADRRGVPYRDQATAQRFNRASTADAIQSREAYRGRAEQGRQDLASGGADRFRGQQGASQLGAVQGRDLGGTRDMGSRDLSSRGNTGGLQGQQNMSQRSGYPAAARTGTGTNYTRSSSSYNRSSAFQDMDRGNSARNLSSRGQASRQSMSRPSGGGSRAGGGGGRAGGGGGRR